MRKTSEQKGITLIALIITIVVLLILAVVAINSIQNDGIISHAGNTAETYNQAADNEQQQLQNYLDYLDKANGGSTTFTWTQNGTSVTNGTDTFSVGEKVKLKAGTEETKEYTAGDYTGDWVVLGAENGKMLLVSSSNVVSNVALGGINGGNINGTECVGGYDNGVEALDTICEAYLNATYADSARSITAEDLYRVTGFVAVDGNTYTITDYILEVSGTGTFIHPDGREIGKDGLTSIQETSTSYSTNGSTFMNDKTTPAYKALFDNTGYESGSPYWLATQNISVMQDLAHYGLRVVYKEVGIFDVSLWASFGSAYVETVFGVRAVVSIKSDVKIVKAEA